MIRGIYTAVSVFTLSALLLVLAAEGASAEAKEPLVRIEDDRIVLPTSLGTPVYLFEPTFSK